MTNFAGDPASGVNFGDLTQTFDGGTGPAAFNFMANNAGTGVCGEGCGLFLNIDFLNQGSDIAAIAEHVATVTSSVGVGTGAGQAPKIVKGEAGEL